MIPLISHATEPNSPSLIENAAIESAEIPRKRICFVTAAPSAINAFLRSHINALKIDYDIILISSGSAKDLTDLLDKHVSFISLRIERKISIKNDILALFKLWWLFRKENFDSVHSLTPKAGLLSMLAARFAGVPLRFHTFTGQVWATRKGLYKLLLKFLDRLLAMSASQVLADSHSQRLFLIKNGIVKAAEIDMLAEGSFTGVDLDRFKYSASARQRIRSSCEIHDDAILFIFLGRLNADKGLTDLFRAFRTVAEQKANTQLMIVGTDEEGLEVDVFALAQYFPGRVHRVGYTNRPEDYLSAADVLCLPSYREGFPNVPLQAASIGIPTIASKIYGITDAVENGVTGILHKASSEKEIAEAMILLASNAKLRCRMGTAARKMVVDNFSQDYVTKAFVDFYRHKFSLPSSNETTI